MAVALLHVKILAVGRLREPYLQAGCTEYLRRLSAYAQVEIVEIKEEVHGTLGFRTSEEAKRLEAALPVRCHLIVLDERGKQISSPQLAQHIDQVACAGLSTICFIIGGADGVAPRLRARAQH